MTSRATSALRKPNSAKANTKANTKANAKSSTKPATKAAAKKSAAKSTARKAGQLPEWNLADLYSGIDAPEVAN